ncbi:DNA polymerase III subunit gamma/tau [Rickettsiales bacterium LUAb2]
MTQAYQALAIKYRPQTINELKGQDVLVTTLKNAFELNRISHAFMLTGVRGVGKTTTARIIAKALNCIGADGNGNITLNPCGICEPCVSISKDLSLDVLEMDAASKTGIDDIREVIDNVKYNPISCRYKVFIIDEIHMLSKSAFNALLKTLEEPPPYVKFIFATTEIKKVPITIISRCQKFDLRRLDINELSAHLAYICQQENIPFEEKALSLIAKAGDGSVRDSLSILDQAISHTDGNLTETEITKMLGLNNKANLYDLFENLVKSNTEAAIDIINQQYQNGNEMISIFEDLLEICHFITMIKIAPKIINELTLTESEKQRGELLANNLTLNNLITLWQILLKGIDELKLSIFPKKTAEMLVVRITWVNNIANIPALKKVFGDTNLITSETSTNASSSADTEKNLPTNNNNVNLIKEEQTPVKAATTSENITPNNSSALANSKQDDIGSALLEEIQELFPKAELINKEKP